MPAESLGALIRQRRNELGLTQEQLAEQITERGEPIRQADISRIERGLVEFPRRARLEVIAAALGLSFGDLLARTGWFEPTGSAGQNNEDSHTSPQRLGAVERSIATRQAGQTYTYLPARHTMHRELREILTDALHIEERFQRNVELVEASRRMFVETRKKMGRGEPSP